MRIMLQEGATEPLRATRNAACYDLYANEDKRIMPNSYEKVATGVHFELPSGICGTISHRSGMNSKQGIQAFGRIDPDYRGEIFITLFNDGKRVLMVRRGDRVAQVMFAQFWAPSFEVVESLTETKRGGGGHGSTGV